MHCDCANSRGCYVQDERYIAGEHMDVRRDCVSFARDQYIYECSHGARKIPDAVLV